MKTMFKTLLIAGTLALSPTARAEEMKMCEPGMHCPMMERMSGMQQQMGGMMEQMHQMMSKPCDQSSQNAMGDMMQQMKKMHAQMGSMMDKSPSDTPTAEADKDPHASHHPEK